MPDYDSQTLENTHMIPYSRHHLGLLYRRCLLDRFYLVDLYDLCELLDLLHLLDVVLRQGQAGRG